MTDTDARKAVSPEVAKSRQRARNIAIAFGLVLMVVLFYAATIVHLGGDVANRGL